MAIAQPIVTMIKRSAGSSAVGSAAYRSGSKLHDERLDVTHNFTFKQDVTFSEILAPDGCATWVFDREQLWNKAEAMERQWNGQPAREVTLILPRELSADERIELVREFALTHWVSKGMIADVNHHAAPASDSGINYHAHVLLTMRRLEGDAFAKTKERQWNRDFTDGGESIDPKKGGFYNVENAKKPQQASRDGWVSNHKSGFMGFRQNWESAVNTALADSGSQARVDLRNYRDQGRNIEPQKKLGIHAKGRKGWEQQARVIANEDIADRNEVRRYLAPAATRKRCQAAAQNAAIKSMEEEFWGNFRLEQMYGHEQSREQEHEQGFDHER